MKNLALGFAACSIFLLCQPTQAQTLIGSGQIQFHGAIVEPAYELGLASNVDYGESGQLIEVAPGVVIAMNMALRKGRGSEPLYSMSFTELKNPPNPGANLSSGKKGVVTISYR
ncbi:hypothetical protein ABEU86_06440 [Pseudomonas paraversuta]|jgi:hypothetical protein|uniref:hypothetical protein n=1 Tax=Pseudomonas TaxID=286 RepID=UPI000288E737|nr:MULTISPECIES: hypothetical protein [unclassified Pseudomonas]AMB78339.1 hypothetical protein AV641_04255 [Pseudomonas fragi]NBF15656.1 hypothetical protein [Pseudomonas sp. Fl4BN2]NNG63729.1 hypothetical protein [Pseudomonas sp. GC01]AUB74049.1 hypothetical protein B195_004145 [Pseudomonas sp. Lz4W]NBG91208.1 hypothetical protein [Pseudomonas sp. 9.1(2019)]